MPNMNMQIAHTIKPVRMFFCARRRVIIARKDTYCGGQGVLLAWS
jgi:hypothetical protein